MSTLDGVKLTLVDSLSELDEFRRWLGERRPVMGLDIETSGLSLVGDRVRMVQFGDARSGWALPWEDWRGAIREVIDRYEGAYVLQHAKFDAGFLKRDGIRLPWDRVHDTMIMLHLIDNLGPHSLKPASKFYIDPRAAAGQAGLHIAMRRNGWTWATVPVTFNLYWGYGALDAVLTAQLAELLWGRVQPYREAYDLEVACERVLCDLELRGVHVDVPYCEDRLAELNGEIEQLEARVAPLNLGSNAQVVAALQSQGAAFTKLTEKGQLALDDDVLKQLARRFELAGLVLKHRSLSKIASTWFASFVRHSDNNGLLHPHVNQLAAKTGRMSVTEPPLQTIPRKKLLRDAFIPRDGNLLVLLDYASEELRVAAHLAQDPAMLSAFAEGRDLYHELATRVYGSELAPAKRPPSKAGLLGKIYGAGVDTIAETLGISMEEAGAISAGISQAYPGLDRAMAKIVAQVRERAGKGRHGWIRLVDGRRLNVPVDKAYVAFNWWIQGSCATVLKRSLVDLDLAGLGDFLVLPVHDENVLDVPEPDAEEVSQLAQATMRRDDFSAPLEVGIKIVRRWGDAYE